MEHFNRLKLCKTPPNRIAGQDHLHVHHPAINKDPLNNKSAAQRYAKDATNMLHEEDELWEPKDVRVPAAPFFSGR